MPPILDPDSTPPEAPTETDDVLVILEEAGADRRELGRELMTAEARMAALEHEATVRGFARHTLAFRKRDGGGVDYRYVEVRGTTTSFARSPRYVYWVTDFSERHTGLSRDEAIDLMRQRGAE